MIKFKNFKENQELVYLCIGSENHVWDSVGPLIGSMLRDKGFKNVYGFVGKSVNSKNIENYRALINENHKESFVIAIDACITDKKEEHKKIVILNEGLNPGMGLNKNIDKIGDASILICIFRENFNTNKNLAAPYKMAENTVKFIEDNLKGTLGGLKMRKCKYCGGNEFIANIIETKIIPGKVIGDDVVELFDESIEPERTAVDICYCCTCNKEISAKDLITVEICTVCGKEVDKTIDGKCEECSSVLKDISSPEELLAKILKGEIQLGNANIKEDDKKGTKETKSKSKTKAKSKKETNKVKEEKIPKEVTEKEVEEAKNSIENNLNESNNNASTVMGIVTDEENVTSVKEPFDEDVTSCGEEAEDIMKDLDAALGAFSDNSIYDFN